MTFPFFNSLVTHFVILSFILTMPLNSGSFTVNSFESLLVNFGNEEEGQEVFYDLNLLETGIKEPGQVKKNELSIVKDGPEKITPVTEVSVSAIKETAAGAQLENSADSKVNNEIPAADLISVREMPHEALAPEAPKLQIAQMKTMAVEDIKEIGKKIDETSTVIAGEVSASGPGQSEKGAGEAVSGAASSEDVEEIGEKIDETTAASAGQGSAAGLGHRGEVVEEAVYGAASFEKLAFLTGTFLPYGLDATETIGKGTQAEINPVFGQQMDVRRAEENVGTMGTAKSAPKEKFVQKDRRIGFGLPKIEAPVLNDIKIEVTLAQGEDTGFLSIYLLKRPYPLPEWKIRKNKQENVSCAVERKVEDSEAGSRQTLSVVKAEKGIYTFVIKNNGTEGRDAAIVFHLYEGQKGKRTKEYKKISIQPSAAAKVKFMLPDALFWDDEDRFSGEIENSMSTTKFNYESGVVWREEKE